LFIWEMAENRFISITLKVGNKVRLDKAAMGATYLYKDGSHQNIKVKQLK